MRTSILTATVIGIVGLTLAGCSSTTPVEQPTAIPEVTVEASATASPEPADSPTPAPDVAPDGDVTKGEEFALTVPVGKVFLVPVVLTDGSIVDIKYAGDVISRELPKGGGSLYGPPVTGTALSFTAAKVGVAKGAVRVLGSDGKPTGTGTRFVVTVVK